MERDELTELLNRDHADWSPEWRQDIERVYTQLKNIARSQRVKVNNSRFMTTELVNEAWLKTRKRKQGFEDRNHFFAYCALAMRHILYNQAKRNKLITYVDDNALLEQQPVFEQSEYLLELEKQLSDLREFDPRLERVFTFRFFGDMDFDAIAQVLDISERTALRDWKKARAMLAVALCA